METPQTQLCCLPNVGRDTAQPTVRWGMFSSSERRQKGQVGQFSAISQKVQ